MTGDAQFLQSMAKVLSDLPATFIPGLSAWLAGHVVALVAARLLYAGQWFRELLLAASAVFGLMPFIVAGTTLNIVDAGVGAESLMPIEWALVCVACLFPALDQAGEELRRVDARYGEIMRLAGMPQGVRFWRIAIPHLVPRMVASARATLAFAVLLTLMFQYGRGVGLGLELFNIIQSGDLWSRSALVVAIASCIGLAQGALTLTTRVLAQHKLTEQDSDWALVTFFTRSGRDQLSALSGWLFAVLIYLLAWHQLIAQSDLDAEVRYTPLNFARAMILVDWNAEPWRLFPGAAVLTLIEGLVFSVVGVASACVAVGLAENRWIRAGLGLVAAISQSIPIFLLIPIYVMLLQGNFALVGLLTGISVTFFQGYALLQARLSSAGVAWIELRRLALPGQPLSQKIRARCKWLRNQLMYYGVEVLPIVIPQGIIAAIVLEMFVGLHFGVPQWLAQASFQPEGLIALSHRTHRGYLLMNLFVFNTLLLFMAALHFWAGRRRRMRETG